MRDIKIDDYVWGELQRRAVPFEDSPNDVLRRLLSTDEAATRSEPSPPLRRNSKRRIPSLSMGMSAKARGNLNRQRYFKSLVGRQITMNQVRGVVFRSRSGAMAVIPSATERSPGKWFLGIAAPVFNEFPELTLILLCEKEDELLDFVLPWDELTRFLQDLSRDSNNQLKFNIAETSSGRYLLSIPSKGPFDLTPFLGHCDPLRNRASAPARNEPIDWGANSNEGETRMLQTATSEACVYKTDRNWIEYLRHCGREDEVNFWRGDSRRFEPAEGAYLYFLRLRGPNQVEGRGIIRKMVRMSSLRAWDRFGVGNGAPTREKFLESIKGPLKISDPVQAEISCIILDQVEWLDIPVPFNHDRGTWVFKYFAEEDIEEIVQAFDEQPGSG